MSDIVLVGLMVAVPSTITALAAFVAAMKVNRKVDAVAAATVEGNLKVDAVSEKMSTVAEKIDGRLSQLLESTSKEQHAAGKADGIEAERNR